MPPEMWFASCLAFSYASLTMSLWQRTDIVERELAAREQRADIRVDVAAMERVRIFRSRQPMLALVDLAHRADADAIGDQRQRAVVGRNDGLAVLQPRDDRLARRADSGIDDGYEYRSAGQ